MNILTVWHLYPRQRSECHVVLLQAPQHKVYTEVEVEQWELPENASLQQNEQGQLCIFCGDDYREVIYNDAGTVLMLCGGPKTIYLKRVTEPPQVHPIKAAREAAGFTVRGLAEAADISKNTLHMLETGQAIPRADTLRRLADILGKTMDELWP